MAGRKRDACAADGKQTQRGNSDVLFKGCARFRHRRCSQAAADNNKESKTMNIPTATETFSTRPTLNILVVDDEATLRELISSMLAVNGHIVVTAANGREALEKFFADKFDLVLTDRAMPEMNGDELAQLVKAAAPDVPVIMVTAYGYAMNGQALKPRGVDSVVHKPFHASELLCAIEQAVL
jgi:CheY-like chemotaxis protein